MKVNWKLVMLGVSFYLLFLFTQIPANKIYYVAEDLLSSQSPPIKLYGVSGSIWQGEAKRLSYGKNHFNQVAWEFHPLALLTGKLSTSFRFKNEDGNASGLVSYGITGDISAEDLRINMQASEVLKMARIPAFKLDGEIKLNLPQLVISENRIVFINGRLLWSDAKSIFPQRLTLGNLVVDMSTDENEVITAKLDDGGGELVLDGSATLMPDGKYNFNGEFSARQGRQSVLGKALGFMARYNSNGKAIVAKAGNISEFGFLLK